MKLHHLRNATFIIESGEHFVLVDPMLGRRGALPPLAVFRHRRRRNPLVDLPHHAAALLDKVTHCLITHCRRMHVDHLDRAGEKFLSQKEIPTTCTEEDSSHLRGRGIRVAGTVRPWREASFLDGTITAVPAQHGHGWVHHIMANGVGFHVALANEPSIYVSGDTVMTADVRRALLELKPDVAVVAAGNASVDVGQPILMSTDEIIEFTDQAPRLVIANHLEALNHCPMTRERLQSELRTRGLLSKTLIPDDGESVTISRDQLRWTQAC